MLHPVRSVTVLLQGRSLIDIMNTEHHNPKYLPGVHLGDRVVVSNDLEWVSP